MDDVYRKYRNPLLGDAKRRLGDETLAEDCVQETFITYYMKLDEGFVFDNENKTAAFLYKTNANNALHMIRDRQRRGHAEGKAFDMEEGRKMSVEETVEKREQLESLDDALESIPMHHAIPAMGKYAFEMDYKDFAEQYGMGSEAVRKCAERGLRELKEKLKNF